MPHCETCECDNPNALSTFNARCRRLIASGAVRLSKNASNALGDRLVRIPPFDLGFREFMPDQATTKLGGLFLCAVQPGPRPDGDMPDLVQQWRCSHRFFTVVIPSPLMSDDLSLCVPEPVEYRQGDVFNMVNAMRGEVMVEIASWPDRLMARWLRQSRDALHAFVEAAIA